MIAIETIAATSIKMKHLSEYLDSKPKEMTHEQILKARHES